MRNVQRVALCCLVVLAGLIGNSEVRASKADGRLAIDFADFEVSKRDIEVSERDVEGSERDMVQIGEDGRQQT